MFFKGIIMKIASKTRIIFASALVLIFGLFVSCGTTDSASTAETAPAPAPAAQEEAAAGAEYAFNASNLKAGDFADGTKIGDNDYFTLNVPDPTKPINVDGNNKNVNGVSYTQRLKLGGETNTLSFTMASAGTVNIVCQSSSGSADRKLLFLSNDAQVATASALGASPLYTTIELPAGTYTLQSSGGGGTNIYFLEVIEK